MKSLETSFNKRLNTSLKKIRGVSFLLLLSLTTPACYQMVPEVAVEETSKSQLELQKVDCQFVSVETLSSIIKNQIGLPAGDVTIKGDTKMSLVEYAAKLGKGNMASGVADENSCGALKYKLATQVMIDACTEGLNTDATFVKRLFPNGTDDYAKLYTTLLGRLPTAEENAELDRLRGSVSSQVFPAAACAAVAASVESLNRT